MTIKAEYRVRAQRFLGGPFQPADLTALFLFLRNESCVRESVRDLGDMIGHSDIRDKGLSVKRVCAAYQVARHVIFRIRETSNLYDLKNAQPDLLEAMGATLYLLSDDIIRRDTGMSRDQALTALAKLKRKFSTKSNGNLEWNSYPPTQKELATIKCLTGYIISQGAYEPEILLEDVRFVFRKYGLIDASQDAALDRRKDHLSLFVLSVVHGVRFTLPGGELAEAAVGWSDELGTARLNASVTMEVNSKGRPITLAFPFFSSGLSPSIWLEDYDPKIRACFLTGPIEIVDGAKLRRIR